MNERLPLQQPKHDQWAVTLKGLVKNSLLTLINLDAPSQPNKNVNNSRVRLGHNTYFSLREKSIYNKKNECLLKLTPVETALIWLLITYIDGYLPTNVICGFLRISVSNLRNRISLLNTKLNEARLKSPISIINIPSLGYKLKSDFLNEIIPNETHLLETITFGKYEIGVDLSNDNLVVRNRTTGELHTLHLPHVKKDIVQTFFCKTLESTKETLDDGSIKIYFLDDYLLDFLSFEKREGWQVAKVHLSQLKDLFNKNQNALPVSINCCLEKVAGRKRYVLTISAR